VPVAFLYVNLGVLKLGAQQHAYVAGACQILSIAIDHVSLSLLFLWTGLQTFATTS
jgi:hypothetical protein